jgi:FOG: TPR repeat, SEL1 subfamily
MDLFKSKEELFRLAQEAYRENRLEDSVNYHQKAAKKGDTRAMIELGLMYQNGIGVETNYEKAIDWFESAASHGDESGLKHFEELNKIIELENMEAEGVNDDARADEYYRMGKHEYDRKNYSEAFGWTRKAADYGNLDAQQLLSVMYVFGQGVEVDYHEAFRWAMPAAEGKTKDGQFGDKVSQNNLGFLYFNGKGVEKDIIEGYFWFKMSAMKGYERAIQAIESAKTKISDEQAGELFRKGSAEFDKKNHLQAFKYLIIAADFGHMTAQSYIGYMFNLGLGIAKDIRQAIKYYRLAAEQGSATSQFNLALIYGNGQLEYRNSSEAFKYYLMAAENNHVRAQYQVGLHYEKGLGTPKDLEKAVYWYRLSAESGNDDAKDAINRINDYIMSWGYYQKGLELREKGQSVLAAQNILKSAELGFDKAQQLIGIMYERGEGLEKNLSLAFQWTKKAAEQENTRAQIMMGMFYIKGQVVTANTDEAIRWTQRAAQNGDPDAKKLLREVFNINY